MILVAGAFRIKWLTMDLHGGRKKSTRKMQENRYNRDAEQCKTKIKILLLLPQ